MRVAEAIETDEPTELELRRLAKGRRVEARVQQRAQIILLAAQGWQNKDIAEEVKLDRRQVALWRRRFLEGGVQALLQDAARSGRTPSVTPVVESAIVRTTLYQQREVDAPWTTRSMASHLGLSATTVRRVWQRNGIQTHAPGFVEPLTRPLAFDGKLVDVVGLYMHPHEHVLVLGCDESAPGRPARAGSAVPAVALSPEEVRNGVATLYAALRTLDRRAIPMPQDLQGHRSWLLFLRQLQRETPAHLRLFLIVENCASLQHPEVQAWLAGHERVVTCAPPGDMAWSTLVKRLFRDIAERRITRHSFARVPSLLQAIDRYIEGPQKIGKPFAWVSHMADTPSTPVPPLARGHGLR